MSTDRIEEIKELEDKVYNLEERNGELTDMLNRCINYLHTAKGAPSELIAEAEDLLCSHHEDEED